MDEKNLSLILDITGHGLWDWDIVNNIVTGSSRYFEILGLEKPADLKITVDQYLKLIDPVDSDKLSYALNDHFGARTKNSDSIHRIIRPDGNIIWIHAMGRATEWSPDIHPTRMLGMIKDITEETNAKIALNEERAKNMQSNKLATLGEMASGIAHEINNPLTIIRGYLKMIECMGGEKEIPGADIIESVKKAQNAIERTAKIVSSLKYFSRDASRDPLEVKNISDIVEDTLAFCQARVEKQNVELIIEVPNDPELVINCHPVEISQIILNLVLNSFDAVKKLSPEKKWIKLIAQSDKKNLLLKVIDGGDGISPNILTKIFDPFVTTKPAGAGTGLGLSISKTIATANFGDLTLESASAPTTFLLTIPLAKKKGQLKADL